MDPTLRYFLLFGILLYGIVTLCLLRKGKLNLKYTLLWLLCAVIMFLITIFPSIITWIANLVGVYETVNMVFMLEGLLVLLILLSLTVIVSHMTNRIYCLAQKQALLENRVRELEAAIIAEKTQNNELAKTVK